MATIMKQGEYGVADDGLVRVCSTVDVAPGEMSPFDIDGFPPLALYNRGGTFYATSNICTHEVALLTDGYFDDDIVECPLHGGAFNMMTGEPAHYPCVKKLATFPVTVIGDDVFVARG